MTTRRRSSSTRQPGDQDSFGFHGLGWFLLFSMDFHGSPENQMIMIIFAFKVFGCFFAIFNGFSWFTRQPSGQDSFGFHGCWLVFAIFNGFSWFTRQPGDHDNFGVHGFGLVFTIFNGFSWSTR